MRIKIVLFLLFYFLTSFDFQDENPKMLIHANRFLRSSFCLFNDGKFYRTNGSGCVGQDFSWGTWTKDNDIYILTTESENIFNYKIVESKDTQSKFQTIQIIDCYNRPVRFQSIFYDTTFTELYNTGMIKLVKKFVISYNSDNIDNAIEPVNYIQSNSDTIKFKWNCNRESIESINGGRLYFDKERNTEKIRIENNRTIKIE